MVSGRARLVSLWLVSLLVGLVLVSGCGSTTTAPTATQPLIAKDANGTTITIPASAPQRIVSLGATPSEILGALGLAARVVGVDAFTNYPADMAAKTKVTAPDGTANVEQIVALKPDLVLSYGGETTATDTHLMQVGVTVVDLPATNLTESLVEIRLVGQLTHTEPQANALVSQMQHRINTVEQKVRGAPTVKVYMEVGYTPGPPYAFGGGSFGDEMIRVAGGSNIFGHNTANGGYPQVSEESIIAANPQVIVLTEDRQYGGDPAQVPQRTGWGKIAAVQQDHIYVIDPDLIQRPGPRIVEGLEMLAKLIHPERFA